MNKTIELNMPKDSATRVRRNIIDTILGDLVAHKLNLEQAAGAIEHLFKAASDEVHATGRTRAGNDISGI